MALQIIHHKTVVNKLYKAHMGMKAVLTLVFSDFLWISDNLRKHIKGSFLLLSVLSTWVGEPPSLMGEVSSEEGLRIWD